MMKRRLGFLLLASLMLQAQGGPPPRTMPIKALVTVPPPATPHDDSVTGLNEPVMKVLRAIAASGVVPIKEREAEVMIAAVKADGTIDTSERDLLDEMIKSEVRSVRIADPAAGTDARIIFYPFYGKAREMVIDAIEPPVDFAAAWDGTKQGWKKIIDEAVKGGFRESRAEVFVKDQLAAKWAESNSANSYKPLREEIQRLYILSMTQTGPDVASGRSLLFNAANRLDGEKGDAVPDFLFSWIKPPAT